MGVKGRPQDGATIGSLLARGYVAYCSECYHNAKEPVTRLCIKCGGLMADMRTGRYLGRAGSEGAPFRAEERIEIEK